MHWAHHRNLAALRSRMQLDHDDCMAQLATETEAGRRRQGAIAYSN
jgi:hypothetical protein